MNDRVNLKGFERDPKGIASAMLTLVFSIQVSPETVPLGFEIKLRIIGRELFYGTIA